VTNARELGQLEHLSDYLLVDHEGTILWVSDEGDAVDVLRRPGQIVLASMDEVLGPFTSWRNQKVVALRNPKPGIALNPDVLGGFPAIEGTRIPYDSVTALANDGLDAEGIRYFYPSVPAESIPGALDFADYVAYYNIRDSREEVAVG